VYLLVGAFKNIFHTIAVLLSMSSRRSFKYGLNTAIWEIAQLRKSFLILLFSVFPSQIDTHKLFLTETTHSALSQTHNATPTHRKARAFIFK